jgi:predicted TIM-barrel fold metal-dependent hydrolase
VPSLQPDERLFVRPEFDVPQLDGDDITMYDDAQLMTSFMEAIAWQNFVATIAVEAEVREAALEEQLATAEARAMLDTWSTGKTVGPKGGIRTDGLATEAKLHRDVDPDVIAMREQLLQSRASRKRAQVVRDNCERIANLLSRELTRRVGREPVDRRGNRYSP